MIRVALGALLLSLGASAHAGPEASIATSSEVSRIYDLYFGGFWAAELRIEARFSAETYQAEGEFRTKGIVGWFDDTHIKVKSIGRMRAGSLSPIWYRSSEEEDDDRQYVEVSFSDGGPSTVHSFPEFKLKPWSINVDDQSGTTDPLSAILAIIEPSAVNDVCAIRIDAFDGRRRFAFHLDPPERLEHRFVCKGEYVRLAGFKPKTLKERGREPFAIYFTADGKGRYIAEQLVSETSFGTAVIKRRN